MRKDDEFYASISYPVKYFLQICEHMRCGKRRIVLREYGAATEHWDDYRGYNSEKQPFCNIRRICCPLINVYLRLVSAPAKKSNRVFCRCSIESLRQCHRELGANIDSAACKIVVLIMNLILRLKGVLFI